jgi:hypothetical protein
LVSVGAWVWRAASRIDLPVKVPATAMKPYSFDLPAGWSSENPFTFAGPVGIRSLAEGGMQQGTFFQAAGVTVTHGPPPSLSVALVRSIAEHLGLIPADGASPPAVGVRHIEIDDRPTVEGSVTYPGGRVLLIGAVIPVAPHAYVGFQLWASTGSIDDDVAEAIVKSILFDDAKLHSAIITAS